MAHLGDGKHDGPALDGDAVGGSQHDASHKHEGGGEHRAPLAANLVGDEAHEQHAHDDTADLQMH